MKRVLLILGILIVAALAGVFYLWDKIETKKLEMPDSYQTIMNRGYLIVGVKTDTKPFGYIDKDGQIVGLDIDIAKAIAKFLFRDEKKLKLVSVTPSDRLIKLTTGDVDIVIATMTVTPQRLDLIDFSHAYFIAGQTVLVPKDSKISALGELGNHNVGVIFGTTAEKNLRTLVPTARVFGYRTYDDAYEALNKGIIQAITSDDTILRSYALNNKSVRVINRKYSKEPYAIGVRKGKENKLLLEKVNFVVKTLVTNNSINHLYSKWGLR